MNRAGGIAAIVLAAGKSSRMGASKPLLPLGAARLVERVVATVAHVGIGDIVVVTGHDSDKVAPILERLPVRRAHNAGYESGMFSSVRTGVGALPGDVEAFFVLPVDYPLVRPEVLDRLIDAFRADGPGILHPSCCGRRGHPPLISGRYHAPLLQAGEGDDLRTFLLRHADDEAEVDVEDLTILMDMDTNDDYQRMGRFAGILDAAAGPALGTPAGAASAGAALSPEDASYLLSLLEVPDHVVRHCRTVAAVGVAAAEALKPHMPGLNVDLVRSAGLLHDMAKATPKHAVVAQNMLANLGLSRLGEVIGAHIVLPPEYLEDPLVTEEELLYLADKLVVEDRVASLDERAARTLRRHGQGPSTLRRVRRRMQTAQMIRERVESVLQRPLDEVLPR
jgi:molybdenum cofactor cytidylyltransferase